MKYKLITLRNNSFIELISRLFKIISRFLQSKSIILFYILASIVVVKIADPGIIKVFRSKVFDAYQTIQPRSEVNFPVVIADIDEASLKAFGQWPWPRTRLAELTDKLMKSGAIVIGYDILFAEKDRLSPPDLAQQLPGLSEAAKQELLAMPQNDAVFAAAINKARVVLGLVGIATSQRCIVGRHVAGREDCHAGRKCKPLPA